jgi:hypothetical protein
MYLPDRVKQAEALAEEYEGILPRTSVLKEKNPQLLQAIHRTPAAFAHIPRAKLHRTPSQWVALAEELAARNGGKLPTNKDLMTENLALSRSIYRYPELFAHIPRAEWTRAKQERMGQYVALAEQLALENGGTLRITREFQDRHNALTCAIRSNPEAFAHIPRFRRRTRSLENHVTIARQLAESNGGSLPPHSVLKRSYPALRTMMQTHPEAFADIPKTSLIKTLPEYVQQAKDLAAEHGGVLPSGTWLRKNGYENLEATIYRRKDVFAGIQQQVLRAGGRPPGIRTL